MSGDLSFEQKVQRTICMDARYLLWCIEKVGKAQNIIDELTIIEWTQNFELGTKQKRFQLETLYLFYSNKPSMGVRI